MTERRQLGTILLESGRITQDDVDRVLEYQRAHGGFFGQALIALDVVSREEIDWALANQFDLPFIFPNADAVDREAAHLVPADWALAHLAVPIVRAGKTLTVVVSDRCTAKRSVSCARSPAATSPVPAVTNSAAKAVDRIINAFPADEQEQIRAMLGETLRGVVAQQLLRTADGAGRVAALEIMVGTPAVGNMIREAKTHQIPSMIQTGRKDGMQMMDQAILELLMKNVITAEEAYAKAHSKAEFLTYLEDKKTGVGS